MLCRALASATAPGLACRRQRRQEASLKVIASAAAPHGKETPPAPSAAQQAGQQLASPAAVPRRAALAAALATAPWLLSGAAHADNDAIKAGLSRYVKKKKLERIDTYIAPLLEAKGQLIRVGRVMLADPAGARQLLRSGVFAGLRENVRAVGEYGSQIAGDESGRVLVRGFFEQLEGFDAALRQAQREGEGIEEARKRLDGLVEALDKLLAIVPSDAISKAEQVVQAIEALDGEAAAEEAAASQLDKLL